MTKRLVTCLALSMGVISAFSWGRDSSDRYPAFPNSKVIESYDEFRNHHLLVSSAMKKVNGIIKADSEQRLDGTLSRTLYLLPDEQSSFAAYDFYTDHFQSQGVKPVYQCQRFHCGDSNFWANNVFNISTLYGLDKEQAYFIGEKVIGGKPVFFSVYTVRRGNRRSYALVDVFTAKNSGIETSSETENNADLSYKRLMDAGYLYMPADNNEEAAKNIKSILSNHTSLEVLIMLNSPSAKSLQDFDKEQLKAEQKITKIKKILDNSGVKDQQYRLVYSGINNGQSSEYTLKVLLIKQ